MYLPDGGRRRGDTDRALRSGLAGLRAATPSPEVWERIAAELPPPRAARTAHWRMSLPVATLAGVALLAVLSLAGLTGELALVRGRDPTYLGVSGADHGLPQAELAIQPGLAPRPVDLTLPPPVRPWWSTAAGLAGWHLPQVALNRAQWPIPEPPLTDESVAPWFDARLR